MFRVTQPRYLRLRIAAMRHSHRLPARLAGQAFNNQTDNHRGRINNMMRYTLAAAALAAVTVFGTTTNEKDPFV